MTWQVFDANGALKTSVPTVAASAITGLVALANGGTHADLSATGAGFLKQASVGADVSVATLVSGDIPNLAASKITSGQLALAQGGTHADLSATGGVNQFLKQSSVGANISVGTIADADLPTTLAGKTLTTPTITIQDNVLTIQDNGDTTKQLQFQASGISTGTTRTLTVPDANTTIVGTDVTQTLTNKTLTTPTIGDFSNATHNHTNAAGGGQITDAALSAAVGAAKGGTGQTSYAAKGDLLVSSGTTTLSKQTVGSDGQVLTADSAQSTGIKWATPAETILVANTALGGSAANIDLTSISGSYKHLKLLLQLRSDRAGNTSDNVYIRLNNDSTAGDYYSYSVNIGGTTPTSVSLERLAVTATGFELRTGATAATAPTDWLTTLEIIIYNYTDTNHPRIMKWNAFSPINTTTGNIAVGSGGGVWTDTTTAINRITLLPVNGSNFVAKSTYELIGIS